jgi:hypothetical protein
LVAATWPPLNLKRIAEHITLYSVFVAARLPSPSVLILFLAVPTPADHLAQPIFVGQLPRFVVSVVADQA